MSSKTDPSTYPKYLQETHANVISGAGWNFANDKTDAPTDPGTSYTEQFVAKYTTSPHNPYEGVATYNPTGDIDAVQAKLNALNSLTTSTDPVTIWQGMAAAALGLDGYLPDESTVDEEVLNFEREQKANLARAYNRVAGGFADINGVAGTAFPAALALLESDLSNQIASFQAKRRLELGRGRALLVAQAVGSMVNIWSTKVNMTNAVLAGQAEVSKLKIALNNDRIRGDVALTVDEIMWEFTLLDRIGTGMQMIAGTPVIQPPMSKGEAMASGILQSGGFATQLAMAGAPGEAVIATFLLGSAFSVVNALI